MKEARCADCPALLCCLDILEPSPAFCPSTGYMKEIRKATHELIEGDLGESAKISSVWRASTMTKGRVTGRCPLQPIYLAESYYGRIKTAGN